MDTATIQWVISFALCIIPWVFPDLPWYWKTIITLGFALLSSVVSLYKLNQKLKDSQKAQQELAIKHNALAAQFDQKNLILRKFQYLAATMEHLLQVSLLDEDKAKIRLIYRTYLETKRELIDGGNRDDP